MYQPGDDDSVLKAQVLEERISLGDPDAIVRNGRIATLAGNRKKRPSESQATIADGPLKNREK